MKTEKEKEIEKEIEENKKEQIRLKSHSLLNHCADKRQELGKLQAKLEGYRLAKKEILSDFCERLNVKISALQIREGVISQKDLLELKHFIIYNVIPDLKNEVINSQGCISKRSLTEQEKKPKVERTSVSAPVCSNEELKTLRELTKEEKIISKPKKEVGE